MKTLAFISPESCSGKTTLAIHMAEFAVRAGKSVTLVDTKPRGCTIKWFNRRRRREGDGLAVVGADPEALPDLLEKSRSRNVDLVIIDTPGNSIKAASLASQVADLVYFPCRVRLFNLAKIPKTLANGLARLKKVPSFIVLNFCNQDELADISRTELRRHDYPVLDFGISERQAFETSVIGGRCVLEDDPAGQATADIKKLFGFTRKRLRF